MIGLCGMLHDGNNFITRKSINHNQAMQAHCGDIDNGEINCVAGSSYNQQKSCLACLLHHFQHVLTDLGGRSRHHDACVLHGLDLARGVSFSFLDDCSGVAHSSLWGSSQPSNKTNNWLIMDVVFLEPIAGHLLGLSSDHDDSLSLGVDYEFLEDVNEVGAIERISSDTNNSGLAKPSFSSLIDGLIGESA